MNGALFSAILGNPGPNSLILSNGIPFSDLATKFPAASYPGKMVVTTINTVSALFISNGTEWMPEGGQATLALSGIGYGIMPSGTVSAGALDHFVSGTALPHTYSAGLWMYFAANVIVTPGLSAGFYWCVFSKTTTCTIYTNGPGSAAINFSVGGAVTGHTSEVTARSVTIPAGLMRANGQIENTINNSNLNSATAKTVKAKLGGSTCFSNAPTTTAALSGKGVIANTTAAVQISQPSYGIGASALTNTRTTIDTTAAATYSLTLQMAAATDYIINHSFRLDLFKV